MIRGAFAFSHPSTDRPGVMLHSDDALIGNGRSGEVAGKHLGLTD